MPAKKNSTTEDKAKLRKQWLGHSGLARITFNVQGTTVDGETVDMGQVTVFQVRKFSTGSVGFNINAKVMDMSEAGIMAENRFQLSGNLVAINSKAW